ncbi:photosystem II assembly protein Psb34 [Leptolyngbya sp. KIOST-1]|uniref:photosystem II assembly protein Psb34 n=1 Tax=Leptolyngbya sp. KIOST-1 TaxID=1229172 RepID=UPI000566537A|nr:ssl1498 family light-harvesting-like protein [Leptolyngbya sp. KIOST-1]
MFTTTQLDNGTLNNYAVEPDVYLASYPSPEQQRGYVVQAAFASLLVASLLLVSVAVS